MNGPLLRLLSAAALFFFTAAVCSQTLNCDLTALLPAHGVRDDVLVIINDNSPASCQVGLHYAQQRQLGSYNVIPVRAPVNDFVDWPQFEIIRDQIIRDVLARAGSAAICANGRYYCETTAAAMRQAGFRYLVTTKGMPARLLVNIPDGNPSTWDINPGSFDNHLRFYLVNYFAVRQRSFAMGSLRRMALGDGVNLRRIDAALDRELAIGRIDGLTTAAAKDLVDRTLQIESAGIFGNLYYETSANYNGVLGSWRDYSKSPSAVNYPRSDVYPLGLFADTGAACADIDAPAHYMNQAPSSAAGKAPAACRARLQSSVAPHVTANDGRFAMPDQALMYLGVLDGQATVPGHFSQLLNWRRSVTCTQPLAATLCAQLSGVDRSTCELLSTDAFREIDTRCIGFGDGFMGYNHQSYPLSYFAAWPTGWTAFNNAYDYQAPYGLRSAAASGDIYRLAYPWVKSGDGSGDSRSLWFGPNASVDGSVPVPQCYADTNLANAPTACASALGNRLVQLQQTVQLAQVQSAPASYALTFDYHVAASAGNAGVQIYARLLARPPLPDDGINIAQLVMLGQSSLSVAPAQFGGWQSASLTLPVDTALVVQLLGGLGGWNGDYSGLLLQLWIANSGSEFNGDIGLDNISLKRVGDTTELLDNGAFDQGHRQLFVGDHAASFLSRLNGVAVWGSVGHYGQGGYSWHHMLDSMILFWRGLPLGDAIWYGHFGSPNACSSSSCANGMLYGDPLYVPVSVRLRPSAVAAMSAYHFMQPGSLPLLINAVNGRDAAEVTSVYSVERCDGDGVNPRADFFQCDRAGSWVATVLSGSGGAEDIAGVIDASALAAGAHTLRLTVTTTQLQTGKVQTFRDFYTFYIMTASSDFDQDGVLDQSELANNTNPLVAN